MKKSKIPLFLSIAFMAILILGYMSCSGGQNTTNPTATLVPKTESISVDGFSFTVNVNNTKPKLGESVNFSTILKNESNTGLTLPDLGGQTTIQVKNEAGQVVWGLSDWRSGTTLSSPLAIGWQFGFSQTWIVKTDPSINIPVVKGKYYIGASDTGFDDPVSKQNVRFTLDPIEIDVSG
jgi:hypothetical protein